MNHPKQYGYKNETYMLHGLIPDHDLNSLFSLRLLSIIVILVHPGMLTIVLKLKDILTVIMLCQKAPYHFLRRPKSFTANKDTHLKRLWK